MEDDKKKNAKGGFSIEISCNDDTKVKQGESLQEAFQKFRKERQVSANLVFIVKLYVKLSHRCHVVLEVLEALITLLG